MRIPFIAANWKMHKTVHESVVFVKEFRSMVKDVEDVEIVVAPPFTAVHAVAEAARNSTVGVAAQNVHWERQGAFTGEVSAEMVREAGAEYVIIGHSERRRLFGDTDELVNRRLVAALGVKITPIVCIGETLEEREGNLTLNVLDRQIKVGLDSMTGRADRRAGHRLRAGLGDRDRPKRDARAGRRGACPHPPAHPPRVRGGRRGPLPRYLRRQRQGRQHPRAHGAAGRRRGPRGWRQPRDQGFLRHRVQKPR